MSAAPCSCGLGLCCLAGLVAKAEPFGTAEELPAAPLAVLLALTDATGSTLRVEHDPRDGRAYLTVTFDGHESPFELSEASRQAIGWALLGPAIASASKVMPADAQNRKPVKQATEAVKQACMCGGKGRCADGGWPCGVCGR